MQKNDKDQQQYDQWWDDFISTNIDDPGTMYRKDLMISMVHKYNPKSVLDAGCGSGIFLQEIQKVYDGKLAGCDVSGKVIDRNKKLIKNIEFFTINLNSKNKVDKQYDMVLCSEVVEHLSDWKQSIETLTGLTKKGGYLLITTQSGKRYNHHLAIGHLQHFTVKMLADELKKYKMEIVEGYNSGWPFMDLKNVLVNLFYTNVEDGMLRAKKQSIVNRFAFYLFRFLYSVSSKTRGPQLVILAKKKS
jgi:2-polyprenyl-3-methyl-5-hydroxy-6-metoxy-1,4-benzoquinol methylase